MSYQFKYVFTGRVLPERTNVQLKPPIIFSGEGDQFSISIASSQITVIAESEKEYENIYTVRNEIKKHVHTITDVFSFTHGNAYSVEIVSVTKPNGETIVFGVDVPVVNSQLKRDERLAKFNKIWNLHSRVNASSYLSRIFEDYRLAMKHAHDTGFYCYRASETIRKYFHDKFDIPELDNNDIQEGWRKMRSELAIDRVKLDEIKRFADSRRHGGAIHISDAERATIFEITWSIIESFIDYLDFSGEPSDNGGA